MQQNRQRFNLQNSLELAQKTKEKKKYKPLFSKTQDLREFLVYNPDKKDQDGKNSSLHENPDETITEKTSTVNSNQSQMNGRAATIQPKLSQIPPHKRLG